MSTRNDYSADEWTAIAAAPAAAGLALTIANSSNPADASRITTVVGRAIAGSALVGAPEIVRVLADCIKSEIDRQRLRGGPAADRAETKDALIGTVQIAVRAIERRSPGELEWFKAWLASVAARAWHAANPGVGDMQRSCDGQDAICRLADVLGVTRRTGGAGPRNQSKVRGGAPIRCRYRHAASG
jgi:hypothetical protein